MFLSAAAQATKCLNRESIGENAVFGLLPVQLSDEPVGDEHRPERYIGRARCR